jgi:aspartate/methionine/tyrosine aminotransferase
MLRAYERRRKVIYEGLNAIDGVSCILPESTFYAFPNISSFGMTSWELAKYLVKEHRVAVVPGSIFGNNGEGYVRISFAVNREILKEGIDRTRAGLEKL